MSDYSPDVELDENGRLVAVRTLEDGEAVAIPAHLLEKVEPQQFGTRTLRISVPQAQAVEWLRGNIR